MNDRISQLTEMLRMKKPQLQLKPSDMLSTGSTLLNMACTGTPNGGFAKGEYVFFVGDSMSGKTWFTLTCLAEAARKKSFRNHRFIFDEPEQGAKMDIGYYFGQRLLDRIEAPPSGEPSRTVQEFFFNLDRQLDEGPCIYLLDSMDALDDDTDVEQFDKARKAFEDGKEVSGSYGTGKAKFNSQGFRRMTGRLAKSGSILIVISQTRDNIGFGAQYNPKTRSGGRALRFYAQMEIWTAVKGTLAKTVRKKKRQQGVITKCQVKKNRHTGQLHSVDVPIYHSYGIDDIASCIAYLLDEQHWKKTKGGINAHDLEFKGSEAQLIKHIEENELESVLREIVAEVWTEIADATAIKGRKRRYE